MKDKIKFIAFDADDTLWENELYFQEFEQKFCNLLSPYLSADSASQELFRTEMKNLHMYGYGLKSMMLSMIETMCRVTEGNADVHCVDEVIRLGQELLGKPVALLEGVQEVLSELQGKYRLVLATTGDLFDQKRKITNSGLKQYFCHIEIMSDKREEDYRKLLAHINCRPQEFLMIGNSVKSDILPVLELGGYAAHVSHDVTWQYEHHEGEVQHPNYIRLESIREVSDFL